MLAVFVGPYIPQAAFGTHAFRPERSRAAPIPPCRHLTPESLPLPFVRSHRRLGITRFVATLNVALRPSRGLDDESPAVFGSPGEDVLRRNVADGIVQSNIVVVLDRAKCTKLGTLAWIASSRSRFPRGVFRAGGAGSRTFLQALHQRIVADE